MRRNSGFTLIEFAIVVTISGILMVAALRAYLVWDQDAKYYAMKDKLLTIKQTLSDFNQGKTRYPCPADPSLPITDANAGIEATFVVAGVTYCWGMPETGKLATPTAGIPSCNLAGQPFPNSKAGSICRILGARDTPAENDGLKDVAEIGGLPFRSMKAATTRQDMNELTMADALDPWGYQFTYAVTENVLELNNKSQGQWGALDVRSEATTTTPGSGVELVLPPQSANYVVVGHGADHNGAYSAGGKITVPCGPLPTGPGVPANSAVDNFNCKNSEIFVDGLLANAKGPGHFDDAVIYSSGYIARLWDYTGIDPSDIYNLNTGGVAVGTQKVTQNSVKLEVNNGDLWVAASACDPSSTATCWTPSVDAPQVCGDLVGNCFNPQLFGGFDSTNPANPDNPTLAQEPNGRAPSNNQCPTAVPPGKISVIIGLNNGAVQCTAIDIPKVPTSHVCPAGKYVFGMTSGNLNCCNIDGTACVLN